MGTSFLEPPPRRSAMMAIVPHTACREGGKEGGKAVVAVMVARSRVQTGCRESQK